MTHHQVLKKDLITVLLRSSPPCLSPSYPPSTPPGSLIEALSTLLDQLLGLHPPATCTLLWCPALPSLTASSPETKNEGLTKWPQEASGILMHRVDN